MSRVLLALDVPTEDRMLIAASAAGHTVVARVSESAEILASLEPRRVEVAVVSADERCLTRAVLNACDRCGVRMIAFAADDAGRRNADAVGLFEVLDSAAQWTDIERLLTASSSGVGSRSADAGSAGPGGARAAGAGMNGAAGDETDAARSTAAHDDVAEPGAVGAGAVGAGAVDAPEARSSTEGAAPVTVEHTDSELTNPAPAARPRGGSAGGAHAGTPHPLADALRTFRLRRHRPADDARRDDARPDDARPDGSRPDGARRDATPLGPAPADARATSGSSGSDGRATGATDRQHPSHRGTVIAVWGPTGAPGRTTVAITLAAELATAGHTVVLADADTYGGAVAPALGLRDEAPGFAAACRLAGAGGLTRAELMRIGQRYSSTTCAFWVLTGIGRPGRWPELSADRVTRSIEACREWADYVVVDTAFSLENDEEISSDLFAPRRNAATSAALRSADRVVAVGAADPIGLARFLRSHVDLVELLDGAPVSVLINRVRPGVIGLNPGGQVTQTLLRFGGIQHPVLIPDDPSSTDAALLSGSVLRDVAPRSPALAGIAAFVRAELLPPAPARRRRRLRRRTMAAALG